MAMVVKIGKMSISGFDMPNAAVEARYVSVYVCDEQRLGQPTEVNKWHNE